MKSPYSPPWTREFVDNEYNGSNKSANQIAEELGVKPHLVRKAIKYYGYTLRTGSSAQKAAVAHGRNSHPPRGVPRDPSVGRKIAQSLVKTYDKKAKDPKYREWRSQLARERYNKASRQHRDSVIRDGIKASEKTIVRGSKLENYLLGKLREAGFEVRHHQKNLISNENMHLDLYLPDIAVAVEIDGRLHLENVFKDNVGFARKQARDDLKNGLLISAGITVIRVQHRQTLSKIRQEMLGNRLVELINKVVNGTVDDKLIILNEDNHGKA